MSTSFKPVSALSLGNPLANTVMPVALTPNTTLVEASASASASTGTDMLTTLLQTHHVPPHLASAAQALADRIDTAMTISELGQHNAQQATAYADRILADVKNHDLGAMGSKLGEIVVVAKSLNLGALSGERSRIPLVGRWVDKLKVGKEQLLAQFQSTDKQISRLTDEIAQSQTKLHQRVQDLEQAFTATQAEFENLGLAVVAGKLKLQSIAQEATQQQVAHSRDGTAPSPQQAQASADLRSFAQRLDKRVGDLQALRMSALQTLPMIRMIQGNNQTLIEKFQNIKELTLPAWRRQFMLALSLKEQSDAVAMTQAIDDATNQFLRSNAELLQHNSVATARANERAVIDISTLEQVQRTLIDTVEQVLTVQREGAQQRHSAEQSLGQLQNQLHALLSKAN